MIPFLLVLTGCTLPSSGGGTSADPAAPNDDASAYPPSEVSASASEGLRDTGHSPTLSFSGEETGHSPSAFEAAFVTEGAATASP